MSIRQQKIQSLLRRELATIFQRESNILFNGRFITVTHVRITPDLANANVFLSIMASKDVKADLKMIDQNNWKVRKLLGERVGKTMRIIPILTFKTFDEVIERANDNDLGLCSYLYTNSMDKAHIGSEKLESGCVAVNTGVVALAEAPFGGIKQTGYGREGGSGAIKDYLNVKYTHMGLKI